MYTYVRACVRVCDFMYVCICVYELRKGHVCVCGGGGGEGYAVVQLV